MAHLEPVLIISYPWCHHLLPFILLPTIVVVFYLVSLYLKGH